ncbi:hypothetical protein ACWDRR_18015, partial [Kitasatospora sp. NPDC003701]
VAVERLRPDAPPADLGSLRADLAAWAVQFAEDISSADPVVPVRRRRWCRRRRWSRSCRR